MCGVCGVCAVRVVVRGAALPLFLWCSPLRCLGAVLWSPCACRVPFPVRAPCSAAWLPLVPFLASLLFTLSSTLLPDMHFFPASALLCVLVFFLVGPGFLLGTCVERGCKRACGGGGFVATRHLELAGTSCDMRVRQACAWVYLLLALVLAPDTSLAATFARCPFRAPGVTCNILVSFPTTLMCLSPLALPTCVWRGPGVR